MIKSTFFIFLFCFLLSVFGQNNLRINEFLTSNINGLVDIESGEYGDWIELYNPSDSSIDLSNYFLTDDISSSMMWQFPSNTFIDSNSYIIVWADDKNIGLHSNFKLSSNGEQLLLYSADSIIVDSISYKKQRDDVSFGRDTRVANEWVFFAEPTPGFANDSRGIRNNNLSDPPEFSFESGFYSSSIVLELSSYSNGVIYYTTDATIPTESAGILYENSILIDSTMIIRAILIEDGALPSETISNSYFINETSNLPIISLTTDPQNLWDDQVGINTIGTNGIEFWGVKANYWQDWERPINIKFFEVDKSLAFNMDAGLAINGARRNMLQKSFRIFARKKYGNDNINYKVFPEKEVRNFSSLVLRNGGYPEFTHTMLRDGFIQSLIDVNMDLESQAYRPCALYINGKYWGIYNIREKQNEEYLRENRGVDPNNLDILENNMLVVEGEKFHYEHMINFIKSNDISVQENYDSVKLWMDVDNYLSYQIAQIYIANNDWPANNIKYWRPRTINGKWRWMVFDVDGGFGLNASADFNSLEFATAENSAEWNNTPWSTFLFRSLLKNEEFKDQFIQRFMAHLSYSFNPATIIFTINAFKDKIESEIPKHLNRWAVNCSITNPESKDGCISADINDWYKNIEVMKVFAAQRPMHMKQFLKNYFDISKTIKFTVESNTSDAGSVYVNGVKTLYNIEAELSADKEIILEAKPNSGYRFLRWIGSIEDTDNKIVINSTENSQIQAVFEPIDQSTIPSIISKDIVLSKDNSPYSTNGDIFIYENSILTLEEGVEINMPKSANIYVYGGLIIKGTKEYPVELRGQNYDDKWGAINLINTTSKSKIVHTNISGTTKGKDLFNEIGGISSLNSELELNYVNMENVQFPIFVQFGNFIMRNSIIKTNITSDLVNVKYGKGIIENCEFIGNNAPDTDAIDYDDVKNGIIRRNKIHDFNGDNSDGIDIGEGAKNVLIEDNFIYNCSDKGISVGQGSSTIIKGNIIINCNLGIGIKDDQSYGLIDHNTFFNNKISVSCFEKTLGRGGGKADISNSIFASSNITDISVDQYSAVTVRYSLSDIELLNGDGNIYGSPGFLNEDLFDFRISKDSPAFDGGDPEYSLDPDGSRTNIGASYTDFEKTNIVVINEINYHSSTEVNPKDWIELYNPTEYNIDLSSWIFKDSNDEHCFVLPAGTSIAPKNFMVLCEDTVSFNAFYPNVQNKTGSFVFGLNNSGEQIRLFDNYGNLIDSLTYEDDLPWPMVADGEGYTLQLINYELDNSKYENWSSSMLYGTPGEENILVPIEKEEELLPKEFSLSQNYPNPFNPVTKINFSIPRQTNVLIKVFDVIGREIITLVDEKKSAGKYSTLFNAKNLSSGIYFAQVKAGQFVKTIKMIFAK